MDHLEVSDFIPRVKDYTMNHSVSQWNDKSTHPQIRQGVQKYYNKFRKRFVVELDSESPETYF